MATKALLICSDTELERILRLFLGEEGFQFQVALTSEECIRLCDEYSPDVVILDNPILEKGRLEISERIREHSHVPIMVLSYLGSPGGIGQALDAGADDYLVKPVHTKLLVSRLRSLVRRFLL